MNLRRAIALLVLAASLAGCGVVDLISNGFAYCGAVATDLEHSTGIRPEVGFHWRNGSLETVTVTFPRLSAGQALDDLAGTVREVVKRDFKETPTTIVLAFELKK